MLFNNFLVFLYVLICFSFYSYAASEQWEKLSAEWSFSNVITYYDAFAYLKQEPVVTLEGDISGVYSTSDIKDVESIFSKITADDRVFFDYDEVLFTADYSIKGPYNCRLTHDSIRDLFLKIRDKAFTYILSFGNNYAYEGYNFRMFGRSIPEPLKNKKGGYINPLPVKNDLQGLNPFVISMGAGAKVAECIDFCSESRKPFDDPVLSLYPELGAFHVGRAHWYLDFAWNKIQDNEIEKMFGLSGCNQRQLKMLKYLYARVPVKGRIMKTILMYLSKTGDCIVPRDIFFVDDSLLNCKAFVFYVLKLKDSGYFTGNVKAIHLSLPDVSANSMDKLVLKDLELISRAHSYQMRFYAVSLITLFFSLVLAAGALLTPTIAGRNNRS